MGENEVGQPLECGRVDMPMTIGFGFLANHHVQFVQAALAILILNAVDPTIILHRLPL